MKNRRLAILFLSLSLFFTFAPHTFANQTRFSITKQSPQIYWRTELYFGRDKNDGTQVSDKEWEKFVDEVITPKFPQGLTVIDAKGQWRNDDGIVIKETSKLLILLYPSKSKRMANTKIQQIRKAYIKLFNQRSVMRIDTEQNYLID